MRLINAFKKLSSDKITVNEWNSTFRDHCNHGWRHHFESGVGYKTMLQAEPAEFFIYLYTHL